MYLFTAILSATRVFEKTGSVRTLRMGIPSLIEVTTGIARGLGAKMVSAPRTVRGGNRCFRLLSVSGQAISQYSYELRAPILLQKLSN